MAGNQFLKEKRNSEHCDETKLEPPSRLLPVNLPSIERLRVENHGGRVPSLGTADADFSSKFHPGDGENRASVGTRQGEHVLLLVFQEPQHTSRERGRKS